MSFPKLEQPNYFEKLTGKVEKNLLEEIFHSLWAYFGILNKAEHRILTNGFFVSMQKSRNVWAPCIYIQWAENGKIVSSQDQKNSWNQMFIQFHEKTWDNFFLILAHYVAFFYTLLTLSEVRCLVSLVVATV